MLSIIALWYDGTMICISTIFETFLLSAVCEAIKHIVYKVDIDEINGLYEKKCKFVEVAFKDWSDKMEDLLFVLCCLVIYIVYQLVPYKSEVTMVLIYGIGLEVTFRLISKYRARYARKEGQGDTKKDEERVE